MGELVKQTDNETQQKYLSLLTLIHDQEKCMRFYEIAYIFFNLIIFIPTAFYVSGVAGRILHTVPFLDMLFILFCHVFGICINTYWAASSMRMQLKLKLRYFQARFLERKMNRAGEFFFSDESPFFDIQNGKIASPDGQETLRYPSKGFLRMDGFIGSAKPRTLSLFFPLIFFIIYIVSFVSVLFTFLS
jgi:hypothetical protein